LKGDNFNCEGGFFKNREIYILYCLIHLNMRCNRLLNISWIFLIVLLLIPCTLAQKYYADIQIDINSDGKVDISGSTNHPSISSISKSDDFTTKNKKFWVVNVSVEDDFSQYIAEVSLPPKTSLNFLKASNVLSIKEDNGRIVVTITGKEEPLLFLAQYSFGEQEKNTAWLYYSLIIILVGLGLSTAYYFSRKNKKPQLRLDSLTDRQKEIIDVIQKNKGSITQAELEKSLEIPKASLSRNIDSLVRKNILLKESKGMTNQIMIKPENERK